MMALPSGISDGCVLVLPIPNIFSLMPSTAVALQLLPIHSAKVIASNLYSLVYELFLPSIVGRRDIVAAFVKYQMTKSHFQFDIHYRLSYS